MNIDYQLIADYTYDWEYLIGQHGEPIYHSSSVQKITGYEATEFFRKYETPKIHISIKEKSNQYTLTTIENGIGIDPEYFDKIFGLSSLSFLQKIIDEKGE